MSRRSTPPEIRPPQQRTGTCPYRDTVITIPNSTFSEMELENYAKREKIWYHPRIQLAKHVTPDQVRYVLVEVRKMLYAHPKVDP